MSPPPDPEPQEEAGRPRRRRAVALLAALVLALAGTGGWFAGVRLAGADGDPQAARERAMATAEQFMLRINQYGPDELDAQGRMPDYRARVGELLTPRFLADFEENVPLAEQSVAQVAVERSAEVFATGVSDLDPDSAEVLVAGRILQSVPAAGTNGKGSGQGKGSREPERVDSEPVPFRMVVSLRLVEGEWLVDDYAPASAGAGASGSADAGPGTGAQEEEPQEEER